MTGALQALGKFTSALASRFGGVDQAAKSWGEGLDKCRDRAECSARQWDSPRPAWRPAAPKGGDGKWLLFPFFDLVGAQEFRSLVSGILEPREADSIFRMTLGPQGRADFELLGLAARNRSWSPEYAL